MPYLGAVPVTASVVDVIDGTIVDADIHTAAAIASSKIAHGTTANKILALNSSAQIPAVDGALLTNLPLQVADPAAQTPTAGQTTFNVTYTVGRILVFLNGVKLLGGGTDFTASNGTTVVLTTGAATTDKIEFLTF